MYAWLQSAQPRLEMPITESVTIPLHPAAARRLGILPSEDDDNDDDGSQRVPVTFQLTYPQPPSSAAVLALALKIIAGWYTNDAPAADSDDVHTHVMVSRVGPGGVAAPPRLACVPGQAAQGLRHATTTGTAGEYLEPQLWQACKATANSEDGATQATAPSSAQQQQSIMWHTAILRSGPPVTQVRERSRLQHPFREARACQGGAHSKALKHGMHGVLRISDDLSTC